MDGTLRKEDLGLVELEQEPLDVLDLPQIYTKPSAKTLLDTLSLLSVESRSWVVTPSQTPGSVTPRTTSGAGTPLRPPKRKVKPEGVSQYLTRIVSSPLAWIADENDKEKIWDTASTRLSERAGRTAMGSFTRMFSVPSLDAAETCVDVSLHEPALTGDNLGFKTWAASYVLASRWNVIIGQAPALEECRQMGEEVVLELGAGTGLVGIAAAAVLGAQVILTDLPFITDNLARNVKDNEAIIDSAGGSAKVAVLDWTDPGKVRYLDDTDEESTADVSLAAKVIVVADAIYSKDHPPMLLKAVKQHLSKEAGATVILAIPIRPGDAPARADLRERLSNLGLQLAFEEDAIGQDDWSEGKGDEARDVSCSVMVWTRT